jgi:hypothetical protein
MYYDLHEDSLNAMRPSLKHILMSFRRDFLLLSILALFERFIIPAFLHNAGELFQLKYSWTFFDSANVISVPELVFAVMAVPMGMLIDKRGFMGLLMIFGFLLATISHAIFFYQKPCPPTSHDKTCLRGFVPMTILGIANNFI